MPFFFTLSWSPLPDHTSRVSPVHLPGCTCVPDAPEPHRLCALWGPEVEESWKPRAAQQIMHPGTCSSAGFEEPDCVHGCHWDYRPLCPAPNNPPFHGWVCRRPGQLLWGSSSVLPWFDHGGPVEEINQIHGCDTDITYYSKTVSTKIQVWTNLHLFLKTYSDDNGAFDVFNMFLWHLCW